MSSFAGIIPAPASRRRGALVFVSLLAALGLIGPSSPARAANAEHTLAGPIARDLAIGFGMLGGGIPVTVTITELPSCWRFEFIGSAGQPPTTLRFGKLQSQSAGGPCTDKNASVADLVLPGAEAAGIVKTLQGWSSGDLDGAPPLETLSASAFSIVEIAQEGSVLVTIVTPGHAAASCLTPQYSYSPERGQLARVRRSC